MILLAGIVFAIWGVIDMIVNNHYDAFHIGITIWCVLSIVGFIAMFLEYKWDKVKDEFIDEIERRIR